MIVALVDHLMTDLSFAFRQLLKSPGFTLSRVDHDRLTSRPTHLLRGPVRRGERSSEVRASLKD